MHVIHARNVNDAYAQGLAFLRNEGRREPSRAGDVLVSPVPVATVYSHPTERVLMDPRRDANPFFHFFEPLWLLAGRDDARWLDRFVKDFSLRFSEADNRLHGSYGKRWRSHFSHPGHTGVEDSHHPAVLDQINEVVYLLNADTADRQALLTMWDPATDLGVPGLKDRPCNTQVMLRVREQVLDILVTCRSNDIIWGAYGANMPQFSVLQEYLAGRIGVGIGTYTQLSWNFHAYLDALEKVGYPEYNQPYVDSIGDNVWPLTPLPMVVDGDEWDKDLRRFMAWTDLGDKALDVMPEFPHNPWFEEAAVPLFIAHTHWRNGVRGNALSLMKKDWIAPDWRAAALAWMHRRMK